MPIFLPSWNRILRFGWGLSPLYLQGATFSEPLLLADEAPSVQQPNALALRVPDLSLIGEEKGGDEQEDQRKASPSPALALPDAYSPGRLPSSALSLEARFLAETVACLPSMPLPRCLLVALLEAPSDLQLEDHPVWRELCGAGLLESQEGGVLITALRPIQSRMQYQESYPRLGKALAQAWCYDYHHPSTWPRTATLAPVLVALWEERAACEALPLDLLPCLARLVHYQLTFKADHALALRWSQELVTIWTEQLGTEAPQTAIAQGLLALSYEAQKKYEQALGEHEQAHKKLKASLGESHPDTLIALHNLANGHYRLGNYDEALRLHEEGLILIDEDQEDAPLALAIMRSNIGALLYQQGNYQAAITHHEQALATYLEELGEEHPSVGTAYQNLGAAYAKANDLQAAIHHYELALATWVATLGEEHGLTLRLGSRLESIRQMQESQTSSVFGCPCL